jgi:DNA-binding response OmpR family regulator
MNLDKARMTSAMADQILVVEDDKKTASLIKLYLDREGFQTVIAYDGQQALELAEQYRPVFVILDLMLPLVDGWEVCRRLRQSSDVPILMLTARGEEVDRVSGLTLGADDYVVKPFSPRELVARVKAILRRGRLEAPDQETILSFEGLTLDLKKHKVTLEGHPVLLTPHEFKLLQTLMAVPGKVFAREEILDRLYPRHEATVIGRVVDVHIGKLRQKIEKDPSNPRYILTVRGIGYQFAEGKSP